ncbi:transcription factor Cmr1 [Gaeumannomyces tritici R3-111a-1]|uniref:Transcription factor Cmr1 n=1 Tax=Gaeumannomyces tritici (strain R3-111a-1) TaxID=644352 RepID=J3NGM7_GAET3|nr:transcription factor Cmr1 [Gaeumannomyces tritici R3-111a-1]EJT80417.1 transcription factor Cmr1 [Gaeumannomyces tritici R3-111a-1]
MSPTPANMVVFCTYCGKSFTRKEHLERHIPRHTNVKPHRCGACGLAFARRDLLQRHHTTYHEARDLMEPLPGGVPTVAGRTPIACQNCANAKTGCDKRVPCSRCAEKNLQCAARFARRSSKAVLRAAQAHAAFAGQMAAQPTHAQTTLQAVNPTFMEMDPTMAKQEPPAVGKSPEGGMEPPGTMDPRIHGSPLQHKSPANSLHSPGAVPSPHTRVDAMDDFMQLGGDFVTPDATYNDLLAWPDYSIELDMYPNQLAMGRPEMTMQPFADLNSDVSSGSEPMATSSSRGSIHTRGTSILSTADFETQIKPIDMSLNASLSGNSIPEFEVVVAAEAAWPLARCNPPLYSGACPRTAIVHLECLEQKSKQEGTWCSLEKYLEEVDWDASDLSSVVPLTSRTRDKMLAITQGFLHKALEIHRGPKNSYANPGHFNFIVLPPSKILEYFLRSYVRTLSPYYPLAAGGSVDPNEMLRNNQASTLLVLLMIAQGAAAVPMAEARYLSAGLTETCRISLFDIIEKNVELSADPTALRCALLFTLLGAWSGDKWLMDISMGQRGMYLSMLKHAGMLEPQPSMIPAFTNSTSSELQWRAWCHREAQNRLVYNWVMMDQELSLFHDTAPMLSITELLCPLPGPDVLWQAPNAEAWLAAVQSVYGCTANVNPQLLTTPSLTPSLSDLFQNFLHDNLTAGKCNLSPQQLRLLLHPLQALLCHLRQMLSCFSDILATRRTPSRTVTKASTLTRLEEAQGLLQRWYELSMEHAKENPGCAITRCNLVLYHLISLNAVTSFPEVERLARREAFDGSYWELSLRHKRCIFQREEAIFHCGQVLRLLRAMPPDRRPVWWGGALYRAVLILWTDSISRMDPSFKRDEPAVGASSSSAGASSTSSAAAAAGGSPMAVAVDRVTPEDPAVIAYLWSGEGVALLTRGDGQTFGLDKPADVLGYAVKALDDAVSTRIGDGIKRKLLTLAQNWSIDVLSTSVA